MKATFSENLKKSIVGDINAHLIFLNNFEVEGFWKDSVSANISTISVGDGGIVVNRSLYIVAGFGNHSGILINPFFF